MGISREIYEKIYREISRKIYSGRFAAKKKKKTGHFVGAEKRKVRKRKERGEVEKETTGDKKGNRQARLRKKGWYCEKKGWFMETTRKGWFA